MIKGKFMTPFLILIYKFHKIGKAKWPNFETVMKNIMAKDKED